MKKEPREMDDLLKTRKKSKRKKSNEPKKLQSKKQGSSKARSRVTTKKIQVAKTAGTNLQNGLMNTLINLKLKVLSIKNLPD